MALGPLFLGFLEPIAIGAGTVLALLRVVRLGMPKRSLIGANRRKTY
jgi:hypothetical protein